VTDGDEQTSDGRTDRQINNTVRAFMNKCDKRAKFEVSDFGFNFSKVIKYENTKQCNII